MATLKSKPRLPFGKGIFKYVKSFSHCNICKYYVRNRNTVKVFFRSESYFVFLQLIIALVITMSKITTGSISAMSGLMLAYFEKPSSPIKMTLDSGSWFGIINNFYFRDYLSMRILPNIK